MCEYNKTEIKKANINIKKDIINLKKFIPNIKKAFKDLEKAFKSIKINKTKKTKFENLTQSEFDKVYSDLIKELNENNKEINELFE